MNLSVLAHRIESSGATDPDSLHGLLCLCEGRETPETLAPRLKRSPERVSHLLDRARAGDAGRVRPAHMVVDGETEQLDGLLPARWKREVVAMMLRPDGATMLEIDMAIIGAGYQSRPSHALQRIRDDLKILGVKVEARVLNACGRSSYRIIGRDAWRMQKIIANGWAL